MVRGALVVVVALVLSALGGVAELIFRDWARERWPNQFAWFISYRGQATRWTAVAALMGVIACVLFAMAPSSPTKDDRTGLVLFGCIAVAIGLWMLWQARTVLVHARLEGRRPR